MTALMVVFWSFSFSKAADAQTVVYRETFGNDVSSTSANRVLNAGPNYVKSDWQVWDQGTVGGANAVDKTSSSAVVSNATNTAQGFTSGIGNVGTNYTETTQSNGVVYTDLLTRGNMFFFTTGHAANPSNLGTSAALSISIDPLTAPVFSWQQRDSFTAGSDLGLRLAVQVGGVWYVTNTSFTTTSGTAANQSFTYSATASNWTVLNFTSGSSLELGSAASSDLSGNITGFGLLALVDSTSSTNGNTRRFDNFTVSAVPEPSTFVLLSAGLFALFAFRLGYLRKRSSSEGK